MKKVAALIILVAVVFGSWFVLSPWLAMKGLADAALEGDQADLAERIDFEALRAEGTAHLSAAARNIAGDSAVMDAVSDDTLELIGQELNERALTPEVMASVVRYGALAVPLLPERLRGQRLSWDVELDGINSFRGVGTYEDGTFGPVLYFERKGIGWKLTGFEFCNFDPPCARYGYIE